MIRVPRDFKPLLDQLSAAQRLDAHRPHAD